jgi:hypothetical protein
VIGERVQLIVVLFAIIGLGAGLPGLYAGATRGWRDGVVEFSRCFAELFLNTLLEWLFAAP